MRLNRLVLPLIAVLAGCGGGEEAARTERTESPELSASPSATPSAPAATATPTPPIATAPSAPVPPEDAPGGAGDEEAARVRVDLVITRGGIAPPAVAVAAFLALELSIRNELPRPATVRFRGRRVTVPARATRSLRSEGVRPGRYGIDAGAAGKAELLAAPPDEP